MTNGSLIRLSEQLKALADPSRLRLVRICSRGELSVNELTKVLGQSQPRVSRHLKILCEADILERFREGSFVFYRLGNDPWVQQLIQQLLLAIPAQGPYVELDGFRADKIMEERQKAYARNTPDQAEGLSSLLSDGEWQQLEQAIRSICATFPVGRLLDLGTGRGKILRALGELCDQAVGIDIEQGVLQFTRSHLFQAGFSKLSLRQGNMYDLDFPSHSFDTITMERVFSIAEDKEALLTEAHRLLKPGGHLLIIDLLSCEDPNQPLVQETTLHRLLQHDDWQRLPTLTVPVGSHRFGLWPARHAVQDLQRHTP